MGLVSSFENKTCVSYSTLHSEESIIISGPEYKEEGSQSWLIAAIVVCSVLLVLVVIAYFAARHFAPQRRGASRMEDPQEMCLQGPMIEVVCNHFSDMNTYQTVFTSFISDFNNNVLLFKFIFLF